MTKEQLDAIRARVEAAPKAGDTYIDENGDEVRILEDGDMPALLAEVDRLTAELHRMKSRPVEVEFSRLDTMWQQLVRERDEAVHELGRLKVARSEVNTAKLNDAFTEGTLAAGDAMRPQIAAAFRRGVAAMREAAADLFEGTADKAGLAAMPAWAKFMRALPDPEDTE